MSAAKKASKVVSSLGKANKSKTISKKSSSKAKKPDSSAKTIKKPKPEPCPANTEIRNSIFKTDRYLTERKQAISHGGNGLGFLIIKINACLDFRLYIDQYDTMEKIRVEVVGTARMKYNEDLTSIDHFMGSTYIDDKNYNAPRDDRLRIGVITDNNTSVVYTVIVDKETEYPLNHRYKISSIMTIIPIWNVDSASIARYFDPLETIKSTVYL